MTRLTTLYALNLDELQRAIGSHDDALLNRMLEHASGLQAEGNDEEEADHAELGPTDPTDVVFRIKICNDHRLYLDGEELLLDQICRRLLDAPSGTLEFIIEPPWTSYHDDIIRAANDVIPRSGLDRVVTRFESDDPSVDTSPNVTWTRVETSSEGSVRGGLEFSVTPEALTRLIRGELQPSEPELGRALEVLCYVVGMKLPDDGCIGHLESMDLMSQLETPRFPIQLDDYRGFPVVSFLQADEVLHEALRLTKIDLSCPRSEEVEEARQAYLRCVKQAAIEGLAMVSFFG